MRITRPDSHLVDGPHQAQCLKLQRRLLASTDQRDAAALLTRQATRRHRPGRGGAHGGEVTVVQQQGFQQAGACREQHHHAVEAGQAKLGVIEKTRADLDGEALQARQVSGLHIHFTVVLGNVQPQDRRHRHGGGGQQYEGLFDGVDTGQIEGHATAQVGFAQ
ncbi:hypothetical protein D3C84_804140 [compost metagenome]